MYLKQKLIVFALYLKQNILFDAYILLQRCIFAFDFSNLIFVFLGLHLLHLEVPRLRVELES